MKKAENTGSRTATQRHGGEEVYSSILRVPASLRESGASLLLTLVVVAGIVVLFTILARLVMVEGRVARGYSELQRAEMATQAGMADANNLLLHLFQNFPDSATFWDPEIADTATPGTVFMFRDKAPNDTSIAYDASGYATTATLKTFARPLMSGAVTKEFYPNNQFTQTLVAASITDKALSVDLNESKRFGGGDEMGWIGAMPGATPVPIRVPWVEVLENPSAPKSATNRAVARYAWWAEDESFKLNVNTAKAALRGNPDAETKLFDGKPEGNPQASLQGLFADSASPQNVAESIEEAREDLAATGGQFLSAAQVGHANTAPSDTTQLDFARDYKYLLTSESSGLNLSRTGAKRLNLNAVVDLSLDGIGNDSTGKPDLSDANAPTQIQKGVEQIMAAITENAPRFGQRFFRLQNNSILVPTTSATVASNKNKLDVPSTSGQPYEPLYVRKLAVNIYDYLSPAANPTVMDLSGNVLVGERLYAGDIFNGGGTEINPLAAIGKKRVPYFTEYMINAKMLSRNPASGRKPGANDTIGYADYELEIDHYFEFWNMSDQDIRPADGDMGPNPYLLLEGQPAMSVKNHSPKLHQDVPPGRPFEIKLAEKFSLNGGADADLVFPAGSVTIITTDPGYASRTGGTNLSGKTVYVAKTLYKPGTNNPCDNSNVDFSEPPYPQNSEGSGGTPMDNVRRYKVTSFDYRSASDNEHEIQFGPDMEGSTTMSVLLGNDHGLLSMHPSLAMGPQSSNMIVFKPGTGRDNQYRGSFLGGSQAGYYDPRGSLEAIEIYLANQSSETASDILLTSMGLLNGQSGVMQTPGNSHLGDVAKTEYSAAPATSTGTVPLWNTDRATIVQGAVNAPMVVADGPMKSIGELGHVVDPLRHGTTTVANMIRRRAGGRTLTVGQADTAWDGTRNSAQNDAELKYQSSRSRDWAAWRLADIFTVRRDEEMRGDKLNPTNRTEVAGLYNPNGILRDGGRVLRTLVEGLTHPTGSGSDPLLQGAVFDASKTDELADLSDSPQLNSADAGGQALATYLAQRLTREYTKRFSPIWEPGELSQLYLFNIANTKPQLASGAALTSINDRGREELTRRLMDLITPKGNTFTIYTVGQSLDKQGKPTATKAQRVTVRLRPVFNDPLESDFDPSDATAVDERFRAPDGYALHIIGIEEA